MKKSLIIILIVLALATILRIVSTLRPTQQVIQDTPEDPLGILPFDSGVTGKVLLGPVCPVMQYPPDPACDDRPYETTVQVISVGSPKSSPFATVKTNKDGEYTLMLPPGKYGLQAIGGNPLPWCATKEITIKPSVILQINLSCDTGIR
ncbi:hypothetical protein A2442_02045 [Candidatus Campbellbacteria bacterium RIFOXYC2_FULL_35_25]|uniref:Carboxypeptidase regulatory-like domain-containing protein n=1 Tax=Candidatus Campbellbacteria bacterium RIFOXYC2_FULL_35_25 TaxID=1797582 RepID=A0A1F5EIB1_9BACT|nr:MAG: hypothetical protein A2442_02045 [Candidatus Campbellbacteria bacterium RIFOXYC2_FULL_35_25]